MLLQSVWQLHLITRRNSAGAGGKSVSTGVSPPSISFHPHSTGERSSQSLSTAVSEGINGGCGILLQLKWVVKSEAEHDWYW